MFAGALPNDWPKPSPRVRGPELRRISRNALIQNEAACGKSRLLLDPLAAALHVAASLLAPMASGKN